MARTSLNFTSAFTALDDAVNDRVTIGITAGQNALMVAASDAPAVVQARADYVCDGTADEVEINAALAASKAVVLSTGTFTVANAVLQSGDYTYCAGAGYATIIQASGSFAGSTIWKIDDPAVPKSARKATLASLRIHGNGVGTQGTIDGLTVRAVRSRISDVYCMGCNGYGIRTRGYTALESGTGGAWSCYGTYFRGCNVMLNGMGGVLFDTQSTDAGWIGGEIFQNAGPGFTCAFPIAWISDCFIWGNLDNSNGTTLGRAMVLNSGATRIIITRNKIEQNRGGIEMTAGSQYMIGWNTFQSNSRNATTANNAEDLFTLPAGWYTTTSASENQQDDLFFNGTGGAPTNVIVAHNTFFDGYANDTSRYNINVVSGASVLLLGNFMNGAATAAVNGTSVIIANSGWKVDGNTGFPSVGSGQYNATPGAVTTIAIAHGLSLTPKVANVTPANTNARGAPTFYVTLDATNLTLNFTSALTAATVYQWWWSTGWQET